MPNSRTQQSTDTLSQVKWFRDAAPYINAHRGSVCVLAFDGDVIQDAQFPLLINDIALLNSLGIRLVISFGVRPQIEARLKAAQIASNIIEGVRVTDDKTLIAVKDAVGSARIEIEALLSMGLANTPMSGSKIKIISGNYVTAKPHGVHNGVDFCHTGEIRKIHYSAIDEQLNNGNVVLIPPLGYSPTGEVFNLPSIDVATQVAAALRADKLIFLTDKLNARKSGNVAKQLNTHDAELLLKKQKKTTAHSAYLKSAVTAGNAGVRRVHIVNHKIDGSLLLELYTRDGVGTMVSTDRYEDQRPASINDVVGILQLINPLEQDGSLVRRSREQLELEIDHFTVIERDGMIVGCAALYPYKKEKLGELACIAIHPDYLNNGRGQALLDNIAEKAKQHDLEKLFVLTTRTAHWFAERGFVAGKMESLPVKKKQLYNYQRNSKIFYYNIN